jgi:hypothetical protein
MSKPQLIVVNENTLGIRYPNNRPHDIEVLRAMATTPVTSRFFNYNGISNFPLWSSDKIRLATAKDFEVFKVSFKGFDNPNEFEYNK